MYKKILIPTDGSEYSEKAGEYAIWIANQSFSQIMVLNVIDTSYLRSIPQKDLELSLEDQFKAEGNMAVQKFSKKLEESECNGKCKNILFNTLIKKGKPADEILKTIKEEEIDLVVIGASGKHGLNRLYPGSVTESVVRSAICPVLVVK
ncbi:putative universal stress protein [anaerobic digester metagenome]|nr:MAG: universal stress protein [Methanobacteriales archaeon HGW-Methanobacteriales-2]